MEHLFCIWKELLHSRIIVLLKIYRYQSICNFFDVTALVGTTANLFFWSFSVQKLKNFCYLFEKSMVQTLEKNISRLSEYSDLIG